MEMSGTNKEIRMQTSSFPYNNNHHHHLTHESSSETMDPHRPDPDQFDGSGASATPISVGSRLLNSPPPARYRECLKNYAANVGGSITDGCGEFMPSGDEGTLEALKCAACNCHRNFHRKEITTLTITTAATAGHFFPPPLSSSPMFNHHPHHHFSSAVRIGSGGGTESSSEEMMYGYGVGGNNSSNNNNKKRFRSKFSVEQKERMLEFAEKVGWRIPREDDPEVQRFCAEVGVKRQVLKVWMHNNKAISGKKQELQQEQQLVADSNENID